jgi:hypothetical protein
VIPVRLTSSRYTRRGTITTTYTAGEIDAVAAYCEELEQCYLLPVALVAGMREVRLRYLRRKTDSGRRYTGRPSTSSLGP